jgi:hypothetical protein
MNFQVQAELPVSCQCLLATPQESKNVQATVFVYKPVVLKVGRSNFWVGTETAAPEQKTSI